MPPWLPAADLTEVALVELFAAVNVKPEAEPCAFVLPEFAAIHHQLKRKGMTRQLLWEEYALEHRDRYYRYSQFCYLYQQWRRHLKVSLRQSYRADEKMFVDYAGQTVEIVDAASGECRAAQIFVAVLGASNHTFAEAVWSQKPGRLDRVACPVIRVLRRRPGNGRPGQSEKRSQTGVPL